MPLGDHPKHIIWSGVEKGALQYIVKDMVNCHCEFYDNSTLQGYYSNVEDVELACKIGANGLFYISEDGRYYFKRI